MVGDAIDLQHRVMAGRIPFAPVVLLAALAALPSLLGLPGRWLWLDELLSASFSMHGPWATLVTVLRFDVHPPLYYLQLSLWMLLAQGDAWLMANSVFWHAVAVALLAWTAAGRYGTPVGLGAGLLLAVSPAALTYADQVRMYAFLMALIVWVWHAQARWLEGRGGRLGWLWMVLSQVAVTNSQTAGLLMLSGCVALGAATVFGAPRRRLILRWLLIEAAVALLSLLPVAIGALRSVVHLAAPGAAEVLAVLGFLAGGGDAAWPVALALGLAVLGGLIAGGLRDPGLARDAAALILLPLVLAALLSHLHKPVWIERIFVPVIPFVCLCLARAALAPRRDAPGRAWPGPALLLGLAACWAVLAVLHQVPRGKGDGYRLAAEAMRAMAKPGDALLAESDFTYWSFLWYFAGPRWGDARQAFILNPDWKRMMRRLPPATTGLLGLGEGHGTREVAGVRIVLWDRRQPSPAVSGTLFRLQTPGGPAADFPGRRLTERQQIRQLVLERWDATP